MANCDDINSELSAYHDGALSAAEAARVKLHLAECANCAAELSSISKAREILSALPKIKAPSGLNTRIKTAIAGGSAAHNTPRVVAFDVGAAGRAKRTWLPVSMGLAASLAIGLLCYVHFINSTNHTESTEMAIAPAPPELQKSSAASAPAPAREESADRFAAKEKQASRPSNESAPNADAPLPVEREEKLRQSAEKVKDLLSTAPLSSDKKPDVARKSTESERDALAPKPTASAPGARGGADKFGGGNGIPIDAPGKSGRATVEPPATAAAPRPEVGAANSPVTTGPRPKAEKYDLTKPAAPAPAPIIKTPADTATAKSSANSRAVEKKEADIDADSALREGDGKVTDRARAMPDEKSAESRRDERNIMKRNPAETGKVQAKQIEQNATKDAAPKQDAIADGRGMRRGLGGTDASTWKLTSRT